MIAMLYLKADLAKLTMLRGRNPETPQPTAHPAIAIDDPWTLEWRQGRLCFLR
jgi:hypothetical protein